MGLESPNDYGCILADEMGLGKSIQSIALIWQLMTDGIRGKHFPAATNALIVCPASLVGNWKNEIRKWLSVKLDPIVFEGLETSVVKLKIKEFGMSRNSSCIPRGRCAIISYELATKFAEELRDIPDVIVCDEGHRLKNVSGKMYKALDAMKAKRRVILSGTPLQNNLGELYALTNFVCPLKLGDTSSFRAVFERPLARMRESDCTPEERHLGSERTRTLQELLSSYMLRRTQEVNQRYLPEGQTIQYIFCRPTPTQKTAYEAVLRGKDVSKILSARAKTSSGSGSGTDALACMRFLTKLSNHPLLLLPPERLHPLLHPEAPKKAPLVTDSLDDEAVIVPVGVESILPHELERMPIDATSSKLSVLKDLLDQIWVQCPSDKALLPNPSSLSLTLILMLILIIGSVSIAIYPDARRFTIVSEASRSYLP